MFKGTDIPGILTVSDILDRSFWVFKNKFYSYMMINLAAFGLPFIVMAGLIFSGVLAFDFGPGYTDYFSADLAVFFALISLPSVCADIAMQAFTSKLVQNNEINWWKATRFSFSFLSVQYLITRLIGWALVILVSGLSFIVVFIPFIGAIALIFFYAGLNAFFTGLTAAISIEEGKNFFTALGRNMQLAQKNFSLVTLSAGLWVLILLAFLFSFVVLFFLISELLVYLFMGNNISGLAISETLFPRFVFFLTFFGGFGAVILVYMPLSSIFYSVLYYALRSQTEGYHLENRLDVKSNQEKSKVTA